MIAVGVSLAFWWHFRHYRNIDPKPKHNTTSSDDASKDGNVDLDGAKVHTDDPDIDTSNQAQVKATTMATGVFGENIAIVTGTTVTPVTAIEDKVDREEESQKKEKPKEEDDDDSNLKNAKFNIKDVPDFTIELDEDDGDMF